MSETTIAASVTDAWAAMTSVFAVLEIDPTSVNRASFMIGNQEFQPRSIEGERLSRFLECGRGLLGPNADRYEVTAYLMVQVRPAPGGGTIIATLASASARPRDTSGARVNCSSTGVLEQRIVELTVEAIGN